MSKILKWFVPSSKKLAGYAADGIQKAINQSKYSDLIAKYGNLADKATEIQKWLTEMLKDGKIDDIEKADIQAHLEPLFEKLMEII